MFGYSAEEMIGQSITILIPEDRLQEEPQMIGKLKSGEPVDHFETIRKTKDGRLIDISLTISPIRNNKDEIIGVSKIARDITQQKKEQTRKNDFVAMVSHELKTPLTSILGYVQVLRREVANPRSGFMSAALVKTEAQIKKMMGMVHDFLNVSRLEEGRIHLSKSTFELQPLADEIVGDLQLVNLNHNIILKVTEGIFLYGDREKIGQVLTNLITNAIKYSPEKTDVEIICELRDSNAYIAVSDRGMGISEVDQARLFERYYRVDQNGQGQQSGFGIGLYLVAELLKMHHSKISVKSELGKGSTFFFELATAAQPYNGNELSS